MKKEVLVKESQINIINDAITQISNFDQEPELVQRKINYISKIIDSIIEPERAYKIELDKLTSLKESLKEYNINSVLKAQEITSDIKIDIAKKQVNKIVYDKMRSAEGDEKEGYRKTYSELKKVESGLLK